MAKTDTLGYERIANGESTGAGGERSRPEEDAETVLELEGVTRRFDDETAVESLSLSVRRGELLTMVGPSGCGKTTTLRLLAGLDHPSEGTIAIDGEPVAGGDAFVPPERRDVGIVFQDFALFPHLSVAENVGFGLDDADADARAERVDELLELVDLPDYHDRSPEELSGGERQRVALARSLAPAPEVLLLDEPFSNLDVRLRVEMREEVRSILKRAGVTAISVTHDQEEALSIGDRVAVMHDGHLEQVGEPGSVFQHPESRFVAGFLGQASFLSGYVHGDGVETTIGTFDTDRLKGPLDEYVGARIDVLVRPDDLRVTPANDEVADGEIVSRSYSGPSFVYRVELANGDVVRCLHNHAERFEIGESVEVDPVADHPLSWYPTG
jgi:iron(III) transport system ATP-binding protein